MSRKILLLLATGSVARIILARNAFTMYYIFCTWANIGNLTSTSHRNAQTATPTNCAMLETSFLKYFVVRCRWLPFVGSLAWPGQPPLLHSAWGQIGVMACDHSRFMRPRESSVDARPTSSSLRQRRRKRRRGGTFSPRFCRDSVIEGIGRFLPNANS